MWSEMIAMYWIITQFSPHYNNFLCFFYSWGFFFLSKSGNENKSTPLSVALSIQLFCFFFLTECLSVCISISTRTVTQLSGARRSRNMQPNNSPWQLLGGGYFFCVFQTGNKCCAVNVHILSFDTQGLVPALLINPIWQLFGLNLICRCLFSSHMNWDR